MGNVEQPGKFRQLSVSSSAYTAVKHRVVENTLMEVALGRVDGVVELWRRKEGEWKSVLHLPLSSSAVFCLEFLSPRCEPSDRAAKNSDSQLLVVTTDGVSLLVVPESSSAEDGSHTLRLTFDLFYESTVRCATVLLLGADQVRYLLIIEFKNYVFKPIKIFSLTLFLHHRKSVFTYRSFLRLFLTILTTEFHLLKLACVSLKFRKIEVE